MISLCMHVRVCGRACICPCVCNYVCAHLCTWASVCTSMYARACAWQRLINETERDVCRNSLKRRSSPKPRDLSEFLQSLWWTSVFAKCVKPLTAAKNFDSTRLLKSTTQNWQVVTNLFSYLGNL